MAAYAHLSLHLSKCHIVGNHMSGLKCFLAIVWVSVLCVLFLEVPWVSLWSVIVVQNVLTCFIDIAFKVFPLNVWLVRGLCRTIWIYMHHECEGKIEKYVPRIAVWHHEACRVMTNGDPEGRTFLSYHHNNKRFFFLLTPAFIYLLFKKSLQKSLNTLRCNFTLWRYLTPWVR